MSLKTLLLRVATKHKWVNNFTPIVFRQDKSKSNHEDFHRRYEINDKTIATVLFGSVLIGSFTTDKFESKSKPNNLTTKPSREDVNFEAGEKRPDLPTYTAEEVSKHDSRSSFWVTYKHGVYDVTKFLPSHPGGEQILNAAGLSIEPFWNVYGMHKTQEIFKLLESYRIGNLHSDDVVDHSDEEMWATEPRRDERLLVRTARPFNAETPPQHLVRHFDTPNELFYVRQHMPVPVLDASSHSLRVEIAGAATCSYTLAQLDQMPRVEVRAALMCAGNRRSEMNKVKPAKGIGWTGGAIGSAVWGGVPLRDVLLAAGLDPAADTGGKHVIFRGADIDATGEQFSTSIPLHMALDPRQRVLLATHMNGAPLPRDHGAPLRVVVPGAPAVRSVKWLESITVSDAESPSHWHQKDYRAFNPSTTWETAHFPSAPPVYSLPVTSAVCEPQDGAEVRAHRGHVQVQGYAYSGGGARIVRVDVSGDRGASWAEATLRQDSAPARVHYAWTLWSARLPVPDGDGTTEMEIWVKATDSNFNTQPEKFDDIWNIRGILSNAYHKIKIKIIKD